MVALQTWKCVAIIQECFSLDTLRAGGMLIGPAVGSHGMHLVVPPFSHTNAPLKLDTRESLIGHIMMLSFIFALKQAVPEKRFFTE
jgi:hypothetical protein